MAETYFDLLGLPPTSDFGQIQSAYLRKKSEFKDDPARLRLIEDAYRVLFNPISLRKYLDDVKQGGDPKLTGGEDSTMAGPSSMFGQNAPEGPPDGLPRKRPKTQTLEPNDRAEQNPVPLGPGTHKSGRQRTVIYEPGSSDEQSAGQQPVPAKPAASPKRRQRTEVIGDDFAVGPNPQISPAHLTKPKTAVEGSLVEPEDQAKRDYVLYSFGGDQKEYGLKEGENVIGRPPTNGAPPDIPLPDPEKYISRRHALIIVEGSHYSIKDMGSKNGTLINGQRLPGSIPHPLKNGDVIEIEKRRLEIHIS